MKNVRPVTTLNYALETVPTQLMAKAFYPCSTVKMRMTMLLSAVKSFVKVPFIPLSCSGVIDINIFFVMWILNSSTTWKMIQTK